MSKWALIKTPMWYLEILLVLFTGLAATVSAQPNLVVSPEIVNCGYKVVTEPIGKSHRVALTNTGTSNLEFTTAGIQLRGTHADDFVITTMPEQTTLPRGSTRNLFLTFAPRSVGEKRAEILISTTGPDSPTTTVSLVGEGVPQRQSVSEGIYDGYGPGRSTIGSGGDYPSLYEATRAISSLSLTGGDWDFVILNDLLEPNHSTIQQENNNGHTITFRPAPNTSPRVTFTTTVQTANQAHITLIEPTSHVTFDGSNSEESTSPSLTFANVYPGGSTLLKTLYSCDDITIGNCRFEQESYQYAEPRTADYKFSHILEFWPRAPAVGHSDMADRLVVSNCDLISTVPVHCTTIGVNNRTGRSSWPTASDSVEILSNRIITYGSGVHVRNVSNTRVKSNTVSVILTPINSSTDYLGARRGIYFARYMQSATATSTSLEGNTIQCFGTGGAVYPLDAVCIEDYGSDGYVYVSNNLISGLPGPKYLSTSAQAGIRCGLSTGKTTAVITHNSIAYKQAFGASGATEGNTAGIALFNVNLGYAGTTLLYNNIIRMGNTTSTAIYKPGDTGYLVSNHNNIFTSGSAQVGRIGANSFTSLADWQTSTGHDLASISQDPFVSAGAGLGTWIGPAEAANPDLHFTAFPGDLYLVPPLTKEAHLISVPTDIDSELRNPVATLMGADEVPPTPASVKEWGIY